MKTIMLLLVGTALTCFVYGCSPVKGRYAGYSEDKPLGSGGQSLGPQTCTVAIQYSPSGAGANLGQRQATGTASGSALEARSDAIEAVCSKLGDSTGGKCVAIAKAIEAACSKLGLGDSIECVATAEIKAAACSPI